MRALLCLLLVAGCERDLVGELADAARPDAPSIINDAAIYCSMSPPEPLAQGLHKLFLNTEGQALTAVAPGNDDATTNRSSLVQSDTDVPAFLPGARGRDTYIAQIVAAVESVLIPYSIDIVTTRPAAGPYQMIVLGGDGATVSGCPTCTAFTVFNCPPFFGSVIDLVFDAGATPPPVQYASLILDDLGLLNGLVQTNQRGDCTCRNDATCEIPPTQLCTYGKNVPTTVLQSGDSPPVAYNCGHVTQDAPMVLKSVWGCR